MKERRKTKRNMNSLSWREKYKLALKEALTIKEIMLLRECGQPKATKIRDDSIRYCEDNNIETNVRRVSTEAVFKITGFDLQYYYDKMMQERNYLLCAEV